MSVSTLAVIITNIQVCLSSCLVPSLPSEFSINVSFLFYLVTSFPLIPSWIDEVDVGSRLQEEEERARLMLRAMCVCYRSIVPYPLSFSLCVVAQQ